MKSIMNGIDGAKSRVAHRRPCVDLIARRSSYCHGVSGVGGQGLLRRVGPCKSRRNRRLVCYNKIDDSRDSFSDLRRWLGLEGGEAGQDAEPSLNVSSILNSIDDATMGTVASSSSSGGGGEVQDANMTKERRRRTKAIEEWSNGLEQDWDEWSGTPMVTDLDDSEELAELREAVIRRRRSRRGERSKVRDEYLRPIVDATGIYNRVAIGEKEAEERVFVEAITNQYESREALRYAGVLVGIPLIIGFLVSNAVAKPLWNYARKVDPNAFALTDEQKVAGAEAMHREEVKLRMEASLGQAPDLKDEEILQHLHEEALVFADEMREANKQSLLNVVSDSTSATVFFVLLVRDNSPRAILFRTIGRVFTGLSDTAKAFIIILVTDTLLGYHSEEGWTAALNLLSSHYGLHAREDGLHLFVATVPVVLDSLFKYWIFVGLNKSDPAAAVTLRQMDRH